LKKIKYSGRLKHAIVEFLLPDNTKQTVEIQQNITFDYWITFSAITKQIDIKIRYDLASPSEAYIYTSTSIWLGPIVGLLGGLCILVTGVLR
jgi:hypothetical protein